MTTCACDLPDQFCIYPKCQETPDDTQLDGPCGCGLPDWMCVYPACIETYNARQDRCECGLPVEECIYPDCGICLFPDYQEGVYSG